MSHKKSRKHDVGRGGGGVNLSLIITPMLDMSFQLLAFFVMTYHPPVNVGFVEGSLLPPTKIFISEKKGKDKNPNPPKEAPKEPPPPPVDKEPDVGSDLLLVVVRSVKAGQKEGNRENGDPSTIEIKRTGPQAIEPMIISGNPAEPKERFVEGLRKDLDRELKAILDRPASKILRTAGEVPELKLEVDADLKHRYWMNFYDTCKMSGYKNINFVAPAPDQDQKPR